MDGDGWEGGSIARAERRTAQAEAVTEPDRSSRLLWKQLFSASRVSSYVTEAVFGGRSAERALASVFGRYRRESAGKKLKKSDDQASRLRRSSSFLPVSRSSMLPAEQRNHEPSGT